MSDKMELHKTHATSSDLQHLLTLRERVGKLVSELEDEATIRVDLVELEDAYRLVAEVPGVTQDDLEISVQGRRVTIAGVIPPREKDVHLLIGERPGGHFRRTVELPEEVTEKRSNAHLGSGLLTLHLPKR